MPVTPADVTLQQVLNKANLNQLATILQKMKLGNMLNPVRVVVTGLTATQEINITSAAVRAAATITGLERETGDSLPPILSVKVLRVTASGTANSVGSYAVTDGLVADVARCVSPTAGANVGLALLSNDGTKLTFPSTVTAFVLEYIPRSNTDLEDNWVSGV
jgi:hypothetical protein